ncbi:UDP-2,4-diacetamido-2,4,6-trideoxy-beta-L-altropyranose hydrolase [Bacteroidota bacterium]
MDPKLFIRTDGNSEMGLGHLVRSTALAQMMKDDFEITFFCTSAPESILSDWTNNNFHWKIITGEEDFLDRILSNNIVLLDGYGFDIDYQKKIVSQGAKLVCIDDLHENEFVADLIINHAPGISPEDYRAQPHTRFALGFEYLLLRPGFRAQYQMGRKIEKISTVFICFGGSDQLRLTDATLKALKDCSRFKKIIVVTGSAFDISEEFNALLREDGRIEHFSDLDESQMIETMLKCDLAIVPASSILLEVLAVRLPVITGYYVENQKAASVQIRKLGLAINCGNLLENYSENLLQAIKNLTVRTGNQMIRKQERYVKYSNKLKSIFNSFKE